MLTWRASDLKRTSKHRKQQPILSFNAAHGRTALRQPLIVITIDGNGHWFRLVPSIA